jgi:hypothetical protein
MLQGKPDELKQNDMMIKKDAGAVMPIEFAVWHEGESSRD